MHLLFSILTFPVCPLVFLIMKNFVFYFEQCSSAPDNLPQLLFIQAGEGRVRREESSFLLDLENYF